MDFLVTGGAGFIGSHVCGRLLELGHAVVVLDDLNPFYSPQLKRKNLDELERQGRKFKFCLGDITDSGTVKQVFTQNHFDQVIHLAARAGVRPSLVEPALYQRVNVEGTANILEAARQSGVQKLILASSSSVYGVNTKVPFSEDDPIFSPISPYAASKLACEALAHVYHHVYGMEIAALRFFTVYGPRQRPDLAIRKFAESILLGKPIALYGDGSTARDYTFISDIVEGVVACTTASLGFEIINLGGSQTVSLRRLVELLENAVGRKAEVKYLPTQPGDVPLTFANVSKAHRLLSYSPRVRIDQGIVEFSRWLMDSRSAN